MVLLVFVPLVFITIKMAEAHQQTSTWLSESCPDIALTSTVNGVWCHSVEWWQMLNL